MVRLPQIITLAADWWGGPPDLGSPLGTDAPVPLPRAEAGATNRHGTLYVIDFEVLTPQGSRGGEDYPRLTTCYVK